MAYRALVCGYSSSDDETPSFQCSTTETSTFEMTPCASPTSVLTADEQLKNHLLNLGKEGLCCCVSVEDIAADKVDQLVVGWERRSVEDAKHSQISELSLVSAVDSSHQLHKPVSGSEKTLKSTFTTRGTAATLDSESKLQLRKYIHSAQPDIPYIFRHHDISGGNTSRYIEDYKCCYTYPSMQEKSKKTSVVSASTSTTAVKPTLFVLGGDTLFRHMQYKDGSSSAGLRAKSDPFIAAYISPPNRRRTAPLLGSHSNKAPVVEIGLATSPAHGHFKHRDLGVPRFNSPYSNPRETKIIQVSGKPPIESHKKAVRARNVLKTNSDFVKDESKNIDIATFVQADTSLRSRSSPSPSPTQRRSPITHVTPQPANSAIATEKQRYQVKPSLFNSTLLGIKAVQPCRTSIRPTANRRTPPNHTAQRAKSYKETSALEKHK